MTGSTDDEKLPGQGVMLLTELQQIKVLADPLRIRILRQLQKERTTKQVADLMGEKPTKLYHHMEALERVGLIRLTRTKPNRGTLEKYYCAVAESFRADSRAFSGEAEPGDDEKDALRQVIGTIFQTSSAELTALVDVGNSDDIEEEGILSFLEVSATAGQIADLRKRLSDIIDWLTSLGDEEEQAGDEADLRYRLTLALYPLEADTGDSADTE